MSTSTPATRTTRRRGRRRKSRGGLDLAFVLLCTAMGFEAVGAGVLFPLLARFQSTYGLPTYGLGLMSGAFFFAALLGQLAGGRLLDTGKARWVLVAGLALAGGSLVWFALSANLWEFTVSRAIGGVGYGIIGPAALRGGTVGVPEERRGTRLGALSSCQMAGIVVGPLFGSVLATVGDLATPFYVVAGLIGLVLLAVLVGPQRTSPALAGTTVGASGRAPDKSVSAPAVSTSDSALLPCQTPARRRGRGSLRSLLPPKRAILAVLLFAVASQVPTGLYDSLWSRLMTDRGASSLLIGLSLTIFGLPFIALAPFGGRLASKRGALVYAGLALGCSALFMASYGYVPSPVVITLLGMAEACFQAVAVPGGYAAVASIFPDSLAATGQGWYSAAGTASAGGAAMVAAPVYAVIGGSVFAGGAIVSVIFVVLSLYAGRSLFGSSSRAGPVPARGRSDLEAQ